jgi:hypothetical protein
MDSIILGQVLQYAGIAIEACLIVCVAQSARRGRLAPVGLYLACQLGASLGRAFALQIYGFKSPQYSYVYWTTDFLLVIAAFALVCFFFRRAFRNEEKMWRFARLLLSFVLVLVVGISGASFLRNFVLLDTRYIVEFSQNLYFTCLVLNTLLYILLVQMESTDEQLGLLVCGVGIQFAGPAATMALFHLTTGERFAAALNSVALPVCTLGMLVVWAYAIVRVRDKDKNKGLQVTRPEKAVLAEVTAD